MAVWVGFIALFGTAVQTGVVMVIYLEEAVARKRAAMGTLTVRGLHEAVMEGALLRLRLVRPSSLVRCLRSRRSLGRRFRCRSCMRSSRNSRSGLS